MEMKNIIFLVSVKSVLGSSILYYSLYIFVDHAKIVTNISCLKEEQSRPLCTFVSTDLLEANFLLIIVTYRTDMKKKIVGVKFVTPWITRCHINGFESNQKKFQTFFENHLHHLKGLSKQSKNDIRTMLKMHRYGDTGVAKFYKPGG